MARFFLHVSFPKTGGTTLQNQLFSSHSGVLYLGKPFSTDMAQIQRTVLTAEDDAFDGALPNLREGIRTIITPARNWQVKLRAMQVTIPRPNTTLVALTRTGS